MEKNVGRGVTLVYGYDEGRAGQHPLPGPHQGGHRDQPQELFTPGSACHQQVRRQTLQTLQTIQTRDTRDTRNTRDTRDT